MEKTKKLITIQDKQMQMLENIMKEEGITSITVIINAIIYRYYTNKYGTLLPSIEISE